MNKCFDKMLKKVYLFAYIFTDTTAMQLREAKFKVWSHSECSAPSVWGSNIKQDRMMCAGYQSGNIAACHVGFTCFIAKKERKIRYCSNVS